MRKCARDSYRLLSFDPEKRGDRTIEDYSQELTEDLESLPEDQRERYQNKYRQLLSSWLYSQGNTASAMITGPSNFPTDRMRKRRGWADNKYTAFRQWRSNYLKAIARNEKKATIVLNPEGKVNTQEEINGVLIVTNHEIDRVQIVFQGKPAAEVLKQLKESAWKWSPRNTAWQRKLTGNALWAAKRIVKSI